MKKWKGFLLVGSILAAGFALTGCGSKKVDLNKYMTITVDGYDSRGTVYCHFDKDAFEDDYEGKIKFNSDTNASSVGAFWGETAPEMLKDLCIEYDVEGETDGLSNGDTIEIKWNCDDNLAKEYFNCELEYSDITYTITTLTEVDKFDPFEYVDVSFEGLSGEGKAVLTVDENEEMTQYIDYRVSTVDKDGEETAYTYYGDYGCLSNGDKVTVYASLSDTDDFVERFGMLPEPDGKEYTVSGLGEYVTSADDISADTMQQMIDKGEEVFYDETSWSDDEDLISVSYIGNGFWSENEGTGNEMYMLYKIEADNPDSEQPFTYYYYVEFYNIINHSDGSSEVNLEEYHCPGTGFFGEKFYVGGYVYAGYENLDDVFDNSWSPSEEDHKLTKSINQ